jgi:chromosome partitioning protein
MMTAVIGVGQRKGGVGKTLIATHLAGGWANKGYKVCLIDTDSQGDAGRVLGLAAQDNLYKFLVEDAPLAEVVTPVPVANYTTPDHPTTGALFVLQSSSRTYAIPSVQDNPFRLQERMEEISELFDIVVIDTAPTLSALDAFIYLATDYWVYVTQCEVLSAAGLADGIQYLHRFSKHRQQPQHLLGIVPNMMRANTANHRANLELIVEAYGARVWSPVMQRTRWSECAGAGQLIYAYAPTSYEAREAWRLVENAEKAVQHATA